MIDLENLKLDLAKIAQAGYSLEYDTRPLLATAPRKETTMSEEFVEVNIFLPKQLAKALANVTNVEDLDSVRLEVLAALVKAELPETITLREGMTYSYPLGTRYTIVSLGVDEVVIRRLDANRRGPAGSKLAEKRSKVESDLRTGQATEVIEDDA